MRVRIFKTAVSLALAGTLVFATALPASALVRLRTGVLRGSSATTASSTASKSGSGTITTYSVTFGGLARKYMLYVPKMASTKKAASGSGAPLVFVLHGGNGDMEGMRSQAGWQFEQIADKEGFVIAYPDGTSYSDYGMKSSTDGKGHWNDGRTVEGYYCDDKKVDDVGFISYLIDQASTKVKIDQKRVYATGFSNGGLMTDRLACELSDRLAAAAPVSGTFSVATSKSCNPTRYVPILTINGDADPLVTWDGSAPSVPVSGLDSTQKIAVSATLNEWKNVQKCSSVTTSSHIDADPNDGTNVDVTKYSQCGGGTNQYQNYVVHGGGHTWPGAGGDMPEKLVGKTSMDFNASQAIWDFFKDKTLQSANRPSDPAGTKAATPVTAPKPKIPKIPKPKTPTTPPAQSCTLSTAYVFNSVRYPGNASWSWGSVTSSSDENGTLYRIENSGADYMFVEPGNCERAFGLYKGQSVSNVTFNPANTTTIYYTNFSCADKMKKIVSTSWCGTKYDNASY